MLNILKKYFLNPFLVSLIAILVTIAFGKPPLVFVVSGDKSLGFLERITSSPVHLDDDVMISLRSGYMIDKVGVPSFNRSDSAQASTSYVAPYVYYVINLIMNPNHAVVFYAFLGLLSLFFTFYFLLKISLSFINAVVMVFMLSITTTNMLFSLNGWDHLFQGFFIAASVFIVFRSNLNSCTLLLLPLLLALGTLYRPDGVLISFALLLSFLRRFNSTRLNLGKSSIITFTFLFLVGLCLYLNYKNFGFVLPTTARLKVGASPGLAYSLEYFFDNFLFSYTVLSLAFVVTSFALFIRKNVLKDFGIQIVLLSVFGTMLVAFVNSDVFPGARLFWVSSVTLFAVVLLRAPSVLHFDIKNFFESIKLNKEFSRSTKLSYVAKGALVYFSFYLIGSFASQVVKNVKSSAVISRNFYDHPTAQQFVIAKWINSNLNPIDGAIGLYWLGVSFHLPTFDIADFLGKADELIAQTPVKWGPPGHNKWNEELTLQKWNPQVIIPAGNADPTVPKTIEYAVQSLENRIPYGFGPSLIANEVVRAEYEYCYLKDINNKLDDRWGFFLRNDLLVNFKNLLLCTNRPIDSNIVSQ